MKKLFVTATVVAAIASSSSFAKTEGNYIGAYGMLIKASPVDESGDTNTISKDSTRKVRLGFNYQHAFNFNKFFVSPEAFVEAAELQNKSSDTSSSDSLEINTRYGFKANVGYDVNEIFSPYVTVGRAVVEYSSQKTDSGSGTKHKKLGAQSGTIYGIGANFHVSDSVTANLEYNKQDVDLSQSLNDGKYKTDITSIRFGVAYHF